MSTRTVAMLAAGLLAVGAAWLALSHSDPAAHGQGASVAPPSAASLSGDRSPERSGAPTANASSARTPLVTPVVVAEQVDLRGRVVDGSGRPRVGVGIDFLLAGDSQSDGLPQKQQAAERVAAAVTGADGGFACRVPRDRGLRLQLVQTDLLLDPAHESCAPLQDARDLGDLVARRESSVTGKVVDASGAPVARLGVVATDSAPGATTFTSIRATDTDEQGRFKIGRLRSGRQTLMTTSGRFLRTIHEVSVEAEESVENLVLTVHRGLTVSGQVVDDTGKPVAKIKVGARRKEVTPGVEMEHFSASDAVETDAEGRFVLSGLEGDAVSLRVFGGGHARTEHPDVAVGATDVVLRVARCGTIRGLLKDRAGVPASGSEIRVQEAAFVDASGFAAAPSTGPAATSSADGSFVITNVAPGDLQLVIAGKDHCPAVAAASLLPAQTLNLGDVLVDRGCVARVMVVDDLGAPVRRARVEIAPATAPEQSGGFVAAPFVAAPGPGGSGEFQPGPSTWGHGETGDDGVVTIAGLPSGAAVVNAKHAQLAEALPAQYSLPVSGTIDIRMALRRGGWAAIQVHGRPTGKGGMTVRVEGPLGAAGMRRHVGALDDDGRARIGPLPVGQYWAEEELSRPVHMLGGMTFAAVEAQGLRQSRTSFSVASGADTAVDIRHPVLTRVHGVVTGADGPVAGCVVEISPAGDAATGLGGPSVRTDGDGKYEIADVEAGHYVLRWNRPGRRVKAKQSIHVPADLATFRADLELQVGNLKVQLRGSARGEPVAGAEVRILDDSGDSGAGGQRADQGVVLFAGAGDTEDEATMALSEDAVRSDAAGDVYIEDVPPGTYRLVVRAAEFVLKEVGGQVVAQNVVTDVGVMKLDPAGSVRALVFTDDGKPGGPALVECWLLGRARQSQSKVAMSGSALFRSLLPGRYVLRASAMGPMLRPGPEMDVEVVAGEEPAQVELRLPAPSR